jgi:hypothetical protein
MEILLIILAFLFGMAVGAVLLYLALQYIQKRALKKFVNTMGAGENDPFAMVVGMMNELSKGKRTPPQKSKR